MNKSVVVVCKTTPEMVLKDIPKIMEMARMKESMDLSATTILKDNISWHFPFLSANTTP